MCDFDEVYADIDHGTAALELFLSEDAPVRDTASAESAALDEHDFAELSFIAGADEEFGIVVVSLLEADGEFAFVLLCNFDHFFALFDAHAHGLFSHGMAAGIEGVDDGGSVDTVGGADVDRIGLDLLEHDFPVFEERLFRETPFCFHDFEAFGENIDAGDDFDFRDVFVCFHVGLADAAASDDRHAKFFAFEFFFLGVHSKGLRSNTFVKRHLDFSFSLIIPAKKRCYEVS